MKKFTAMLLAVIMVFALGASAFAADTGDTYSDYTFTDFNLKGPYNLRQRPLGNDCPGHGSRDAAGLLADLQQRERHKL